MIWIAAGAGVVTLGLTALLWPKGDMAAGDSTQQTSPKDPPPPVTNGDLNLAEKPLPTLSTRDGLALWLVASHGVLAPGGGPVKQNGSTVESWLDQETLTGGSTDFSVPKELSPSGKDQSPTVTEITDLHGLVGTHRVVRFSGSQSLVNRVKGDEKVAGGLLDGTAFTVLIVARLGLQSTPVQQRMLAAKCATEVKAWDVSWEQGMLRGGIRKENKTPDRSDVPFAFGENFFVMGFVRDGAKGECEAWVRTIAGKDIPAKKKISGQLDHGPLKVLRLGSGAEFKTQLEGDYFTGDIAELLVYNRPLDSKTRIALTRELSKRYFGK
jgi:hypothetical protein